MTKRIDGEICSYNPLWKFNDGFVVGKEDTTNGRTSHLFLYYCLVNPDCEIEQEWNGGLGNHKRHMTELNLIHGKPSRVKEEVEVAK